MSLDGIVLLGSEENCTNMKRHFKELQEHLYDNKQILFHGVTQEGKLRAWKVGEGIYIENIVNEQTGHKDSLEITIPEEDGFHAPSYNKDRVKFLYSRPGNYSKPEEPEVLPETWYVIYL